MKICSTCAIIFSDYSSEPAQKHFDTVVSMPHHRRPYEIDSNMVRGIDYYTHMIFEIIMSDAPKWGHKQRFCAGGRYTI